MYSPLPILVGVGGLGILFGLVVVANVGQSGQSYPPNVLLARPGVRMTEPLWRVARALRGQTPAWVPVIITSGARSPEGQAASMAYKVDHGEPLTTIYDDRAAARLMALPKPVHRAGGGPYTYDNVEPWAAEIRVLLAEGLIPAKHLRVPPGALDLHTRTLSPAAVGALRAAVARLGFHGLLETVPPHLHVDHFDAVAYPEGLPVVGARRRGLRRARRAEWRD